MSETHHLVVPSLGRSSDAGHLAAADLSRICGEMGVDYRLVGGNAVTFLTWIHGVTHRVPGRETADADFGAEPAVVGNPNFALSLEERGYKLQGGNRFRRTVETTDGDLELTIDVLTPSYTGTLNSNQPVGDLFVDEVPGLALALSRSATVVRLETTLSDGTTLAYTAPLPDVVSSLCMKAYAYRGRFKQRDALDIWRLLEAANAAGVTAPSWPASATGRDAARLLHRHFGRPGAAGPSDATPDRASQARIRALVLQVVAAPQN